MRRRTARRSRSCSKSSAVSVRIRVTPEQIDSWLDDKHIISQELKGNRIGVRLEVEASQPLGIASWRTKGAIGDIRLRKL